MMMMMIIIIIPDHTIANTDNCKMLIPKKYGVLSIEVKQ